MDSGSHPNRLDPSAKPFESLAVYLRLGFSLDEALEVWPYSNRYSREEIEAEMRRQGFRARRKARTYRTRRGSRTIREALRESGVNCSPQAVNYRVRNGWALDEAASTPPMSRSEAGRLGAISKWHGKR